MLSWDRKVVIAFTTPLAPQFTNQIAQWLHCYRHILCSHFAVLDLFPRLFGICKHSNHNITEEQKICKKTKQKRKQEGLEWITWYWNWNDIETKIYRSKSKPFIAIWLRVTSSHASLQSIYQHQTKRNVVKSDSKVVDQHNRTRPLRGGCWCQPPQRGLFIALSPQPFPANCCRLLGLFPRNCRLQNWKSARRYSTRYLLAIWLRYFAYVAKLYVSVHTYMY